MTTTNTPDPADTNQASEDEQLERMLFDFAKYVRLASIQANKNISDFYQIDDRANVDVDSLIKSVSKYVLALIRTEQKKLLAAVMERKHEYISEPLDANWNATPTLVEAVPVSEIKRVMEATQKTRP